MGATTFVTTIRTTASVKEAFSEAHEEAAWEHGHGGYTGTIAEKPGCQLFELPEGVTWQEALTALDQSFPVHYHDTETGEWKVRQPERPAWANEVPWERIVSVYNDKWADAVAFRTEDGFVFCGWASC